MSLATLKKQSNISSLIDEYNKQTTPKIPNHLMMIESGNQNLISQVMVMP